MTNSGVPLLEELFLSFCLRLFAWSGATCRMIMREAGKKIAGKVNSRLCRFYSQRVPRGLTGKEPCNINNFGVDGIRI